MKIAELLLEMPRNILGLNKLDDLDLPSVNSAKFSFLLNLSDKKQLKRYTDSRIVYKIDNLYFCLDIEEKRILYYMEYNTSHSKILGSFLWQSLVWRDSNVPMVSKLPNQIFFNQLLPKWGIIATDGQQTADGKRFWMYQISQAFDNNDYKVYYHNLKTKDLVEIENLLQFEKTIKKYDIWGNTKDHENKLMIITKHNLPRN